MTTWSPLTALIHRRNWLLVFILIYAPAHAQLCTGNFGDPVVNITFSDGSGTSPFVPSDSYTYTNSSCPDDGFYTITKNTSGCFGDTWHNLSTDHTGDGGGFMLVNASYDPGDFFVTTISDLCPDITYEFAAWILNIMKTPNSIRPNLTFSVETPSGQVLNSFTTGDIPETTFPQWIQYGFTFSTQPGNPVIVLRITNHAPGGIGNDLVLDDITFRPCSPEIPVHILGTSAQTIDLCEENIHTTPYTFLASPSAEFILPLMQWQQSRDSGTTWQNIQGATSDNIQLTAPQIPGSYWYRATVIESSVAGNDACRTNSDVLKIDIHPQPDADAGPDKILLRGQSATLSGTATGEQLSYLWTPDIALDNHSILTPTASPVADITYTLLATSPWGCANTDKVNIKVVNDIYVPNAFSPNNDGLNDRWEIPYLDTSFGSDIKVYNRWGTLVYHCSSQKVSWDGTYKGEPQPNGTYIYFISIEQYQMQFKGTIQLIR